MGALRSCGLACSTTKAEREGFEPSEPCHRFGGFADRCLQPLGHLSSPSAAHLKPKSQACQLGFVICMSISPARVTSLTFGFCITYPRGMAKVPTLEKIPKGWRTVAQTLEAWGLAPTSRAVVVRLAKRG